MSPDDQQRYESRAAEHEALEAASIDSNAAWVHRQLKERFRRVAAGELAPDVS